MSEETTSSTDPAYAAAFEMLLEFDEKATALDRLIHLTILGIRQVEYQPKLLETIVADVTDQSAPINKKLTAARTSGALAAKELERDFPLLHAQAATTLWGALEAALRNLFASLLRDVPDTRAIDEYSRLKVRLAEYEVLEGIDQYLYLVDALEEALRTKRKEGIERFEIIFRALGMSSQVESDVVRCLLELYHFRNVIAHRHGRVDKRLLRACSWLQSKEGAEIRISHAQYHQYRTAINIYLFEIVNRLRKLFDMQALEHEPDCACKNHSFKYQPNLATEWPTQKCT